MYDIKEIGMIPPPYGGVSVYLKRLIENLSGEGFTVGGYYITTSDVRIKSSPLFHKWTWFETKYFPWKIFRYLYQLKKYRIIHSHMGLEGMIYLWTIKKLLRKKVIITVHNSMVDSYLKNVNVINRLFLSLMANENDVIWIAVNEEGKTQLEKLPLPFRSPVLVIPAYVPEINVGTVLDPKICDYLNRHEKNLAFYGHSFMCDQGRDVYGFKEILHIFKSVQKYLPDVGLIYCISDISNLDSVSELEDYAKDLGIHDKIYWQKGSIPSLRVLWDSIDVYIRPTVTDGDSLAIREALEAGAQVVATDVVKRPDGCMVYNVGDIESATALIKSALKLGRKTVVKDFAPYDSIKEIYKSLL